MNAEVVRCQKTLWETRRVIVEGRREFSGEFGEEVEVEEGFAEGWEVGEDTVCICFFEFFFGVGAGGYTIGWYVNYVSGLNIVGAVTDEGGGGGILIFASACRTKLSSLSAQLQQIEIQ